MFFVGSGERDVCFVSYLLGITPPKKNMQIHVDINMDICV